MIPLRKVRYSQEFLYKARHDSQPEVWHLVQGVDARYSNGVTMVAIRNRRGSTLWVDWETEVEVI